MLGIKIAPNFRNPYLAENLVDFWRRWHISLNEWFIEYIYVPMGGGKKGRVRKYFNTFIVFAVSGLWHGASWNFFLWGVVNGLLQITGQVMRLPKRWIYTRIGVTEESAIFKFFRRIIVFMIITTTWIIFRTDTLNKAFFIITSIWSTGWLKIFDIGCLELLGDIPSAVSALVCLLIFIKIQLCRKEEGRLMNAFWKEPKICRACIVVCAWAILFICLCQQFTKPNNSFIYFQF